MKHFFTLLLMTAAAAFTSNAGVNKYQLDIDHADRVKVSINYQEQTGLKDGVNVFTIDDMPDNGMQVIVMPASQEYSVTSVVNKAGTAQSIQGNNAYFYFNNTEEGHYYKITTKDLNESRTASLTVSCDAPEKLSIRFSGTYRSVTLSEPTQVLKFDPETENMIGLEKQYSETFYGVKHNGTDVAPDQYGNYSNLSIANGDNLEVSLVAPDIDYNYTITEMDGAAGFITSVKVDGTAVENINSFKAHAGSTIELTGNTSEYIFEKMEIGAQTVTYLYGSYTFKATADTDIKVYAHKPGKFSVSFTVDDPANVIVYTGYDQSSNNIALSAGEQQIEFSETIGGGSIYINITASAAGVLKSVMKNDIELFQGYTPINIEVAAGDKFVIATEKIVRDWTGMLYVNGLDDSYYFNFQSLNTHKDICAVAEGYNKFEFGSVDLPVGIGFQPKNGTAAVVVLNGETVSPMSEGSFTFSFDGATGLANGDVIKVFINGEPEKYDLTFDMPEVTDGITVRRDHITEISDFSAASTAHQGTVYHLTVPDAEGYTATLGEEALTFDADNTVEFTPTAHAVLSVSAKTVGVEEVSVDNNASNEVYNLQGIRVAGDANALPTGIYIIGGKKVYVK